MIGRTFKGNLGYRCIAIERPDGGIIADCEYQSDHPGAKENAEANARLIAAAPSLLAAMEALISGYNAGGHLQGLDSLPEVQQARKAIAEAKGL